MLIVKETPGRRNRRPIDVVNWLMWVAPIIGVWLIAAPWVVRGIRRTTAMNLSQIIVGACVVLLGLGLSMMVRFRTQH